MTDLALGGGSLAFVGLYLLSLLVLGVWGKKKRLNNSLGDYYLAGRNLGLPVMLLTLFATQYSGNALFGFTGQAYPNFCAEATEACDAPSICHAD